MPEESTPAPPPAASEPAAAVTPPAPDPPAAPTAEETAQAAEDKEWDDAADELFPGIKGAKKEVKKDEPDKPDEKPKKTETPTPPENETPEQKAEREKKEADDAGGDEDEPPEPGDAAIRDARQAARATAQQAEAVKADVREKMFDKVPKVLQDADGDPIKSIDDVMKLINPRTQQPFTEEEAGMWLLSAQQQFNQNLANIDKQVEQIAEVNMDIKDQADTIGYQYGALLKEMPELRDRLWLEYEKTLVKDKESGIITKAPVSLESFYDTALKPYVDLAAKLDADDAGKAEAEAKAAQEAEDAKKKKRVDRSDIFGGGNTDPNADPEDKEWSDAATAVFGPKQ